MVAFSPAALSILHCCARSLAAGTLQRSTCSSSQPARGALPLPAARTQRGAVGICRSSGSKRDVSAAFSENQVVTFTAEQLAQEAAEAAAAPLDIRNSSGGTAHAPAGSNGHSYHTISTNGSSNGHAAATNGRSNGNGHSNGHSNGNDNGHSNGKPAAAAAASTEFSSNPAEVDAPALAAAARLDAAAVAAAAADLAAAAWQACASSQTLPGQQLSATTFDCGVTVTISKEAPEPSSSSSSEADSDTDSSMDAADVAASSSSNGGCYYVRVEVPDHFGSDCVLHWGVENWLMPHKACQPPHSEQVR